MRVLTPLLGTALGALLLVGASAAPRVDMPAAGTAAPAITAKSWYNHLGIPPTLASLRGRAVLIEFWATW